MTSTISPWGRIGNQIYRGVRRDFPSPHRCVLSLPGGFPYEAFDGKAEIKSWHVLSMVDSSRTFAFCCFENDDRSFLDFMPLLKDQYGFIGSVRLNIAPEMYDISVSKIPLRIEKELLYHGTSSMNMRTTILNAETDCLLASCEQQTVTVSPKTRRSAPLPDWWKAKYAQFNDPSSSFRIKPSPRPDQSKVRNYPIVVQASDTDAYSHVTWTAFMKFCMDAVAGVTWHRDKSVTISDLYRPVKFAELAYIRECNLGEHLNIEFWSDESSKDKLNFEIKNSNNDVATLSSVEYFSKSKL